MVIMVIMVSDIQTALTVWFSLFSLYELIMSLGTLLLKLISNNSSSDKPIACPHLGHMDAPWYRGKERRDTRVWISKYVCLQIS